MIRLFRTSALIGALFTSSLAIGQEDGPPPGPPPGGSGERGPGGPPGGPGGPGGFGGHRQSQTLDQFLKKMLELDANSDKKLSKDEVTDERLQSLFERADTNKDGSLTKAELTAIYKKESANLSQRRGGPGGGPGGPGNGPGGPGGRGGRGGMQDRFGGPPRPGEVLPEPVRDRLQLTESQKKKLDALQADVDRRLESILEEDQMATLVQMRNEGPPGGPGFGPPGGGPGGFGPPPGGPGGPGGFGQRPGQPGENGNPPQRPAAEE